MIGIVVKLIILLHLSCSLSLGENDDTSYSYDEDVSETIDYDNEGNETEEFDSFAGRDGQFFREMRPSYPLNHYFSADKDLHDMSTLFNYQHKHRPKPFLHKRKKAMKKHHFKRILPLLLTALAKVAHFIPVVKLTLLALFALVLFSKKALLVSIGSLILVLYDTFYKGKHTHNTNVGLSIVKDRGSTVPTVEHGIHSEDHKIETVDEPWYGREEVNPPKINARKDESNSDKWKRWWAPQINLRKKASNTNPLRSSNSREIREENELLYESIEDIIYNI